MAFQKRVKDEKDDAEYMADKSGADGDENTTKAQCDFGQKYPPFGQNRVLYEAP
jgi:hypothetical protein